MSARAVPARATRRSRSGKTFRKTLDLLRRFGGDTERHRPLEAIDARVRLLGFVWLVVAVTLQRSLVMPAVSLAFGLALMAVLRIRRRFYPLWIGALAFVAAISLPAVLLTPGTPVIGPFIWGIAVTWEGLFTASRLILRSAACVTFGLVLALGSDPRSLIRALGMLGVPRVFVMTFGMMHRYLGSLSQAAEEIHIARLSRTIRPEGPAGQRKWVSAGIGLVFLRAHRLTDQVNRAMISRGFDGTLRTGHRSVIRPADMLAGFALTLVGVILLIADHLTMH